ncbi:MAG: Holliday junction branch migration protein RuvA [Oscillospiraceae bacterium]|nr:Holliday junction branch migration protein RuvA [Oscillospiraceae bacterium]
MIASLRGKLIFKDENIAVIECGGVGIKCLIPMTTAATLPPINEEVFLFTHMSVREDALDLYGFSSDAELKAFKLITSVNGVGAKIGLAILSQFESDRLFLIIASGDAKTLTAASGVGLKLAQRIVLELKDKVAPFGSGKNDTVIANTHAATVNSASKEAIEALCALGYTQSEASMAVGALDLSLSTEELIKQALKSLSRRF